MDPTGASVAATTPPVHFLNIEYLFYLIYQWLTGTHQTGGLDISNLVHLLTILWVVITVLAYIISLAFLALFVHSLIRMYQTKDADAPRFATIHDVHHAEEVTEHHRWNHVRQLIEGTQESDWRQAIIEADIMLDDMLTRLGYQGDTVGDKLKAVDPARFTTLQEAWEAHRVRNDIAHRGSTFALTDHLAYRTILHYENVFKEHGEI
ncbi:MAG: hypothetical protein ACM3TU_02210 [Bacillota bacterium]